MYSTEQEYTIDGVKIMAKSIKEALRKFQELKEPKKETKKSK